MKTSSILALITAALLLVAAPQTRAGDSAEGAQPPTATSSLPPVTVDISSAHPRDAQLVLMQIDLNVTIKLYEKMKTTALDLKMQFTGPLYDPSASDEQNKQAADRNMRAQQICADQIGKLRSRIEQLVEGAAKRNQELDLEKPKAVEPVKPAAPTSTSAG